MQPQSVFAGIDIGTSGVKAALLSEQGELLAWAGREIRLNLPQPGWVEQDPQDWLKAALLCLQEVVARAGVAVSQVAGIGLTGQMHSLVCLGASGEVLRPAILWADRRSAPQAARLTAEIGLEQLAAWAGNPLAPGFMLASWVWLREQEPHTAAATRTLLLPKDEVRYRLTGSPGSEPSDASSTLLFDVAHREWSAPLLDIAGLRIDQMPSLGESAEVAGGLLPEMARFCGLQAGTPVVYGASDQAAQALYQGIVAPGSVSCTIGTGGQLFTPLSKPSADPQLRLHLFCHAAPDTWHLEAAMLSAGMALRWLRDTFSPHSSYQELADQAAQVEAAREDLFFLPYLAGERTPWMDPSARGGFVGLSLRHSLAHLTRAVMEGVVFGLRQGLERMEAIAGPLEPLVASGGGTRHPLWLQLQADIFDREVWVSDLPEATSSGAALLAAVGCGSFPDVFTALQARPQVERRKFVPDTARAEFYASAYRQFCSLYPALRDSMHALGSQDKSSGLV